MTIRLFVEPGQVYSWLQFTHAKPPYSIALDGIVNDRPRRNPRGPYANFDHHARVDRLATRSTAEQVLIEINLGLFRTFQRDGEPTANLYVNDADEDTCLSVWLLRHPGEALSNNVTLARLVYYEDRLDATAGAYPLRDATRYRRLAWIFEPYHNARYEGQLPRMEEHEMGDLIEQVGDRITDYLAGKGSETTLEGRIEVLGGGPGWSMVRETGPAARLALFDSGVQAFVVYRGESEGRHHYTLGRRSVWVPLPWARLMKTLNQEDPAVQGRDCFRWGPLSSGSTIGGSPRSGGSLLTPAQVEKLINRVLLASSDPHTSARRHSAPTTER
jgi:hypothetical protein